MDRYRFGVWGIELDDDAFAAAVAGAGAQGEVTNGIIEFRAPGFSHAMPALDAHARWLGFASEVRQIEVTDVGVLDPSWLATVLSRAAPRGPRRGRVSHQATCMHTFAFARMY